MKERAIGWIGRLLWRGYNPRIQYYIKSGFTVVACEDTEWPAILTTGGGEFHVLRVSRGTTISMINFISHTFGSDDEDIERTHATSGLSSSDEIELGDRITAWRTKRGWSLAKKGVGMPNVELSDNEWRLTGSALEKALHDSQSSKVVSSGEAK